MEPPLGSRTVALLLAASLIALAAPTAAAQSSSAEAEQLFREGKRLMKEGKYAEACAAFEASQKAEPAVSTQLNLADCYEKDSRIASAWGAFLEAERQTRGKDAEASFHKTATDRAKKLEPRLSYLTLSVPDESRIDGLELTRNGVVIEPGSWNRAIPVDGGDYTITGHAPAHEKWSTVVHVPNEAGSLTVDVPKFKAVERLMKSDDTVTPSTVETEVDGARPLTSQRKVSVAFAGIGVLAVAAGAVLGIQGNAFEQQALDLCPLDPCGANAGEANDLGDRAEQRWLYANVSFGVAVAAMATAGILWFIGAPDEQSGETALMPTLSTTSAGFALAGRF